MPAKKDWIGMTFGRWTVSAETENPRRVLCVCACGVKKEVAKCSLAAGKSVSCGCFRAEFIRETKRLSFAEKLWVRTERRKNGCLEWTGPVNSSGYGGISHEGKSYGAHVAAWIDTNGDLPKGMHVLHKCDNRRCCEPSHLFLGSSSDNVTDMVNKGRAHHRSGWHTQNETWKKQRIEQIAALGRKPKSEETKARMSAARKAWHQRKISGQMSQ